MFKYEPPVVQEARALTRQCIECGVSFVLEVGEVQFFIARGLNLPRRCAECRAANRAASTDTRRQAGA